MCDCIIACDRGDNETLQCGKTQTIAHNLSAVWWCGKYECLWM